MSTPTQSASTESTSSSGAASGSGTHHKPIGIKETITSLLIAFMLAFIFRGFVIEGFQIPTGSMAPTLLGKNIRFESPHNGYDWTTGPHDRNGANGPPLSVQGATKPMQVTDPMTGLDQGETNRKLSSGDRVFVLKYLPILHEAERWDVVVFKNPGTHENYIKRLVGLPGEQIAIVDGDVFARPFVEGKTALTGWDAWAQDDWAVARKSERVQRAMLQDISDSRYAPVSGDPGYRSPWNGEGSGWEGVRSGSSYVFTGSGDARLVWNGSRPLTDRNAYNQVHKDFSLWVSPDDRILRGHRPFWTADLALSADIKIGDAGVVAMPVVKARGYEFRAVVDTSAGSGRVEMRTAAIEGGDVDWDGGDATEAGAWEVLDSGEFSDRSGGDVVGVEFWHIDQSLWLFVDGELVAGGAQDGGYSMSPVQRASAATGMSDEELESFEADQVGENGWRKRPGVLSRAELFKKPSVEWEFSGGEFTLHNVRVRRDISYMNMAGRATRGGHPEFFPTLSDEEYFMCGDNSARSEDSRLWKEGEIVPWVSDLIDDRAGMVHKDLVVGKAFVVYWPSLLKDGVVPAPDLGRVRWIW
ncbi:MAG: hypothetical protein JJ974_10125 [Phycisphaerales bacterium]|nr:hypothetical protein [Phycisphaerales bacterium]